MVYSNGTEIVSNDTVIVSNGTVIVSNGTVIVSNGTVIVSCNGLSYTMSNAIHIFCFYYASIIQLLVSN